jgi:hypothetical protein
MPSSYYLDESGSIDDRDGLATEIARLKKLHRIQSPELKSTSVRDKPRFVFDLLDYLERCDAHLMVEVIEKRFQICATMTSFLVFPAIAPVDLEPRAHWVRNIMAEYLHAHMPPGVMEAYIRACDAKTIEATERVFKDLIAWAKTCEDVREIAFAIHESATENYGVFQEACQSDANAWRHGLPPPDESKHGKPFWMLPNLSSFTNIYARLNHLHKRRVSGITLFHDEQLQFDEILVSSKAAAERLAAENNVPIMAFADYAFEEKANLQFVTSATDPGIQAADVIAGFTMRYVQDALFPKAAVEPAYEQAFQRLLELSDPERALGVNFVTTTPQTRRLRVGIA